MKNNEKVMKAKRRIGELSSKYAYQPELFDEDMARNEEKAKKLWEDFVSFMVEKNVTPEQFRTLFVRYHEEFIAR